MSTGGFGSYPEHHFRRVIPGDVATVRGRLCDVLEDFNYIVLSDTPIQAKRDKTVNVWVSTMLDCDARLTIGLKAISPVSTSATFDYAVPYLFTQGDMQALEREAEAIIAVATRPLNQTVCQSCSSENGGAVRFCRSCGAPVARNKLPGEIEIMRLTAGVSSSQQEIILALVIGLLSVASTLPMISSSNAKAVTVGWVLLSLGGLVAFAFLLSGLKRLQRTLHPKSARQEVEADVQPALSENDRLAIASQPASVTEGTTSLIEAPEPVPVSGQQGKNTDPMQ